MLISFVVEVFLLHFSNGLHPRTLTLILTIMLILGKALNISNGRMMIQSLRNPNHPIQPEATDCSATRQRLTGDD